MAHKSGLCPLPLSLSDNSYDVGSVLLLLPAVEDRVSHHSPHTTPLVHPLVWDLRASRAHSTWNSLNGPCSSINSHLRGSGGAKGTEGRRNGSGRIPDPDPPQGRCTDAAGGWWGGRRQDCWEGFCRRTQGLGWTLLEDRIQDVSVFSF